MPECRTKSTVYKALTPPAGSSLPQALVLGVYVETSLLDHTKTRTSHDYHTWYRNMVPGIQQRSVLVHSTRYLLVLLLFAGFVARIYGKREATKTSDVWGSGWGKGILERATTGLDGLSRARPNVVQLAHRSEARTLAAKKPGEWSRQFEEAAQQ